MCTCKPDWTGPRCQTLNETFRSFSVAGVEYTLHISPKRMWEDAERRCQQDGLHLLRLYSQRQAISIHEAVTNITAEPYWIGLNDLAREGNFVWSADNKSVAAVEQRWMPGQPDNNGWSGEHCVTARIFPGQDEKW